MDCEILMQALLDHIRLGQMDRAQHCMDSLREWVEQGNSVTGRMQDDEGWKFAHVTNDKNEVVLTVVREGDCGEEFRTLPLHAQQVAKLVTLKTLYPPPIFYEDVYLRCPEDVESSEGHYDPSGTGRVEDMTPETTGDDGAPLCAGCGCERSEHVRFPVEKVAKACADFTSDYARDMNKAIEECVTVEPIEPKGKDLGVTEFLDKAMKEIQKKKTGTLHIMDEADDVDHEEVKKRLFDVQCDETTNSPEDIEKGMVKAKVMFGSKGAIRDASVSRLVDYVSSTLNKVLALGNPFALDKECPLGHPANNIEGIFPPGAVRGAVLCPTCGKAFILPYKTPERVEFTITLPEGTTQEEVEEFKKEIEAESNAWKEDMEAKGIKVLNGPSASDDYYCGVCDKGLADQDCEGDGKNILCPECKNPVMPASDWPKWDDVVWVCTDCYQGAVLLLAHLGKQTCAVCKEVKEDVSAVRRSWLKGKVK